MRSYPLSRVHSVAQQCRSILSDLNRANPDLLLPAGKYGAANRRLSAICNFLIMELEGMMDDTGWDPSSEESHEEKDPDVDEARTEV